MKPAQKLHRMAWRMTWSPDDLAKRDIEAARKYQLKMERDKENAKKRAKIYRTSHQG
jgi:hypothetical protein